MINRNIFLIAVLLLCGCSTVKYTVDDGRAIDPEVLNHIQAYSDAEQAIRPAIVRSAKPLDAGCDKQWEIPFSVATSYNLPETERVAWVRVAKVDERLTVMASAMTSALSPGDKIVEIDGTHRDDSAKMALVLSAMRDRGSPFTVKTAAGKEITVKPFQACRGYLRFSPPGTPHVQDYHWLMSFHPSDLGLMPLTEDEALWMVLWTQGLSEEGGARMKTYHYGMKALSTVYTLATVIPSVSGAMAAASAASAAVQKAAVSQLTNVLRTQLAQEATAEFRSRIQKSLIEHAKSFTQQQAVDQMQIAAANRGSLQGVAWVAGTVFDQADQWAFSRMAKYEADPMAAFTLHQKLVEVGMSRNAFVFDADRLKAITEAAGKSGREDDALAILRGVRPGQISLDMGDMPLASVRKVGDVYADDGGETTSVSLIESLLDLPMESIKK